MRNVLLVVLGFVLAWVSFVFAGGLRRSFGASTAALAGDTYKQADGFAEEVALPMAAPEAEPPRETKHAKKGLKNFAGEGLMGSSSYGIGGLGARGTGRGGGGVGYGVGMGKAAAKAKVVIGESIAATPAEEPAPTRAWFPETFLFEPLVVTGEDGTASVNVTVPDRLTSWRVLALAHSRDGAQAGTIASFLGTLPAYVDPVLPPQLRVGDSLRLPIQVVNTSEKSTSLALELLATGGTLSGAPSTPLEVPARGTKVALATLDVAQPGIVSLKATLGSEDAVEKTVPVLPVGRPVSVSRTGTLAAPRTPTLSLPADVDPKYARARLSVWPGALALLRSELGTVARRGGVADDAYALLLAGRASELLSTLGSEADPDALRRLRIVATQRVVRHARTADVVSASLFAEAAAAHGDHAVLSRISERMLNVLASAQRPDGTFQGQTGWTLQRLLVATADGARAVGSLPKSTQTRTLLVRTAGAFERNLSHVQDGYTAAALLASGATPPSLQDELREVLRKALLKNDEGVHSFAIEADVVRADGRAPDHAEAIALAVLALDPKEDAAARADLGAELLASYRPGRGWGDGRTNLAALRAAVELFREPLPTSVRVSLKIDDRSVLQGDLDAAQLKDLFSREVVVENVAGDHVWTIAAEPPVPGLGFSLEIEAWAPWGEQKEAGLELAVAPVMEPRVGRPVTLKVDAAAPANLPLALRQELPAGVQPDRESLDALVSAGSIHVYEVEDGAVTFHHGGLDPGRTLSLTWKAIPTLAGRLQSGPVRLSIEGRSEIAWSAPVAWDVRAP